MSKIAYVVSAIPKVPKKHFTKSAHSSDFKLHRLSYAFLKLALVLSLCLLNFIKRLKLKNILKEKYEKILF